MKGKRAQGFLRNERGKEGETGFCKVRFNNPEKAKKVLILKARRTVKGDFGIRAFMGDTQYFVL